MIDKKTTYPLAGEVVAPEHEALAIMPGGNDHLVTGGGASYLIMNGTPLPNKSNLSERMQLRYVPEYLPPYQEIHKSLEQMAGDLANRFFRNAETGIRCNRTYKEIETMRASYEAIDEVDAESKSAKRADGALLVGAAVQRMEKLAKHIHHDGEAKTPLEEGAPLPRKEVDMLEQILTDETIVSKVLRRSREADIDGNFYTMLSDNFKTTFNPETPQNAEAINKSIYHAHAHKIAAAMNMIDIVEDELQALCEHLPTDTQATVAPLLDRHRASSLVSVGIPSSATTAYNSSRKEFKIVQDALTACYAEIKAAHCKTETVELISRGVKLVDDMVRVRIPREISVEQFIEAAQALDKNIDTAVQPEHLSRSVKSPRR